MAGSSADDGREVTGTLKDGAAEHHSEMPWYIGPWILGMAALGVATVTALLWLFHASCQLRTGGLCTMLVEHPPWTEIAALATAPVLLVTWYWRTLFRRADVQVAQDQRDGAQRELEHSRRQLALATEEFQNSRRSQVSNQFSESVKLLGAEDPVARVAAVWSLVPVAKESSLDARRVVSVLGSYVRFKTARNLQQEAYDDQDCQVCDGQLIDTSTCERVSPTADVDAALCAIVECLKHYASDSGVALDVDLRDSDLCGAELRATCLDGVNLSGARLECANLSGASLRGAHLRNADLRGANIRGADLRECDLLHTGLDGTKYDEATRFPEGFDPTGPHGLVLVPRREQEEADSRAG